MNKSSSSFLSKLSGRIHPPLLNTPKDSQKLLRSLQKSFRQQLDREHPAPKDLRGGPVDSHFNAVITSPLFTRGTNPVSIRQDSLLAPYEYFKHEVATGNASLRTAKECLRTIVERDSTFEASNGSAKQTHLIKSILRWLWSSGMEESMEFSHDEEFVKLLLANMRPEYRLFHTSKWYKKLAAITLEKFQISPESHGEFLKPMAYFFRRIVFYHNSRADRDSHLKSVMRDYIATSKTISQVLPHKTRAFILHAALDPLVNKILHGVVASKIDVVFYEHFVDIIKRNACDTPWISSVLDLKHPLQPSAAKALSYLNTLSMESIKNMAHTQRSRTLFLICQTMELLLASGQHTKAQDLLIRLQITSPEKVSKNSEFLRMFHSFSDPAVGV